jgi:hypothetical protein
MISRPAFVAAHRAHAEPLLFFVTNLFNGDAGAYGAAQTTCS